MELLFSQLTLGEILEVNRKERAEKVNQHFSQTSISINFFFQVQCEHSELPYYEYVNPDPTEEEMRALVCNKVIL